MLAFESHGVTHCHTYEYILNDVCARSVTVTGDPRELSFHRQHVSCLAAAL